MSLRERVSQWAAPKAKLVTQIGAGPLPQGPDSVLVATILALTGFGVVMVFSAGAAYAAEYHHDWTYFLKREAIYGGAGLLAFVFGMRLDYAIY
ncbi:MAG TPA: hypothetical protein VF518_03050, partial [Polyangia bacterium]